MKINYKTISSFLIYIVSVGALTISDFIVVGKFSSDGVSEWAFYKSVIFVFGGMCVLGFDQLLLREINYYKQFKRQFFIQSILISFIISCFLFLYIKDALKSLFCFFMLFFYANFMFEAGYWRGKKNLLLSQLNKVVLLTFNRVHTCSLVSISSIFSLLFEEVLNTITFCNSDATISPIVSVKTSRGTLTRFKFLISICFEIYISLNL